MMPPRTLRRFSLALVIVLTLITSQPVSSHAARRPDPVVAVLISLGSTIIPLAFGAMLWTQDRGIDEGLRYDLGFVFFSIGGVLGPSTGKFYADREADAWTTVALRGLTGGMGLAGCAWWLRGEEAQIRNNGRALAAIGIGTTSLLALYDIWTSGSAALETQRQRGYGPGTSQLPILERTVFARQARVWSTMRQQQQLDDLPLNGTRLRAPQFRREAAMVPSRLFLQSSLSLSSGLVLPK